MKKLMFFALLALFGCKEEEPAQAVVGGAAPAIVALNAKEQVVKLKQRPTLLTFWSSTCGMCIKELKEMQAVRPAAVDLLAINVDGVDGPTLAGFISKYGLTLPVAADQLGVTAERYRVSGTPANYLIDGQGKILKQKAGSLAGDELALWLNGGAPPQGAAAHSKLLALRAGMQGEECGPEQQ